MGMTPLEGLIMGSRCGDLDPSIPFYLHRCFNWSFQEIENLLNNDSGIKGLCGTNDMREVHNLANQGDKKALMVIKMYWYRICKYIGAYYTILGGLDALVFTAGIGENDPSIRKSVCDNLSALGVRIDDKKNQLNIGDIYSISHNDSDVQILVAKTNEEIEIAKQTVITLQPDNPQNQSH
jgi:acetate kinase